MTSLAEAFARIYGDQVWSSGSGPGARPENTLEYVAFVQRFLRLNDIHSVVDLGCGDWQFSRFIDWSGIQYVGVDVVPRLVSQNNKRFGSENIKFVCSEDIDSIPSADVLLCKDVFQHLPNMLVSQYLYRLVERFKYLIITNDDYPTDLLNNDIPAGQYRPVRLDLPPFSWDCVALLAWEVISDCPPVRKRTILIRGKPIISTANSLKSPTSDDTQIPRRIFQTWKTKSPLPADFARWSKTLKAFNAHFEYVLWDDADNRHFISTHYPWFADKYESYGQEICRVDAIRYFVLFHFGGFYVDLDVECLKPLNSYLAGHDIIVGQMGVDFRSPHSIPNAIMASKPGQEFWLHVFSHLLSGPSSGCVEELTGPIFFKKCIDMWHHQLLDVSARVESIRKKLGANVPPVCRTERIHVLPPHEWYPIVWNDPIHRELKGQVLNGRSLTARDKEILFPDSTLVTYWAHSWLPRPV